MGSWASAIKGISQVYLSKGDYVAAAGHCAGELYGYGHSNVLFKPTKAKAFPFRPTANEAMSYFVGGKAVDKGYDEDAGFAINGGKGWSDAVFDNHQIDCNGSTAIAMGEYTFTCAASGGLTKVEYTFGYKKNEDGKMRIFLHHSSVPYSVAPAPIAEIEVRMAQDAWAGAILDISKVHAAKGDYVKKAGEYARALYGYGFSNVLFKPTKAKAHPFRPTANEAMSYFVGGNAVDNGYDEYAGFAINGGKGWKAVKFDNHQIDINGNRQSRWASTPSRAPPRAPLSRWSTPSATSSARTARFASSSTIRRCRTTRDVIDGVRAIRRRVALTTPPLSRPTEIGEGRAGRFLLACYPWRYRAGILDLYLSVPCKKS